MQFSTIHEFIIKSALDFNPRSESYKAWVINNPPSIVNFYLFNWTNAKDCVIYLNCTKFKFEEVGPYSFYEIKEKVNITWHPNNTISFKYVKRYYYANYENSTRKLSDLITNVNPVAITLGHKMRYSSIFLKVSANLGLFSMTQLVITKTVEEFLFDGYEDHILNTGSLIDVNIPTRFGFFYKTNNTVNAHEMLMHYGLDENFGKLLLLNGRNRTSYYPGECGLVHGSSGEFLPLYSKRDYIEIFSAELCSTARLDYEKNVTVKGIHAYKYGSRSLFDNGTVHPENSCFCQEECTPTGLQNVTLCKNLSPVFLSLPHFYNADPYYLTNFEGLQPDKSKHELYITLEPKSSIVLDLALRMQINILLQPIKNLRLFQNVPKVFVPLFYFDQKITLEDDILDRIRLVQSLPELAKICSVWIIITGGVLIGVAILLFVFVRQKKDDQSVELKKMSGL
ncbi:putative CD36 family [Trypoxylus dichotomus]